METERIEQTVTQCKFSYDVLLLSPHTALITETEVGQQRHNDNAKQGGTEATHSNKRPMCVVSEPVDSE